MTYQEYRQNEEKVANELPIFFAFSESQLVDALKKRGYETLEEAKGQVVRVGQSGALCLKKDVDTVKAYFNRPKQLPELMKEEAFAVEAFEYEMENHEYAINYYQGDWDVCSCFCECEYGEDKDWKDYLHEGGYDDDVLGYFKKALSVYREKSAEWY